MTATAVVFAALAAGLALPWSPATMGGAGDGASTAVTSEAGWMKRYRLLWALMAGLGAVVFVGGAAGVPVGVIAAAAAWGAIARSEPPAVRRRREQRERELPDVVGLLATTLKSGTSVAGALEVVCAAYPGPASDLLAAVPGRLALGMDPPVAWAPVEAVPELAGLARTMIRAQASGASVATAVARLAAELDHRAAAAVEQRARSVGVLAAVPLGVCFLPSFLVLGVVPVVASLMATLAW
ncbi:MAG: type II secretion system F family protein [Nocardioides sp.]